MLRAILTPHLVKIPLQKMLRTLETQLNKGKCHQANCSLTVPFSISPVASQQKMHLGGNVLCEISRGYAQKEGTVPYGHIVIVAFFAETVSINSAPAKNGKLEGKCTA